RLVAECTPLPAPRTARYRCVLALAIPGEPTVVEQGTVEGEIVLEPRGASGFGYDPYFLLADLGRTMAELPLDQKNALSHRGRAIERAPGPRGPGPGPPAPLACAPASTPPFQVEVRPPLS